MAHPVREVDIDRMMRIVDALVEDDTAAAVAVFDEADEEPDGGYTARLNLVILLAHQVLKANARAHENMSTDALLASAFNELDAQARGGGTE